MKLEWLRDPQSLVEPGVGDKAIWESGATACAAFVERWELSNGNAVDVEPLDVRPELAPTVLAKFRPRDDSISQLVVIRTI